MVLGAVELEETLAHVGEPLDAEPRLRPARWNRDLPARARHREPDRDFEYAVLHMLETHGEREGKALETYRRGAEPSTSRS
jgi:hypothetical protein